MNYNVSEIGGEANEHGLRVGLRLKDHSWTSEWACLAQMRPASKAEVLLEDIARQSVGETLFPILLYFGSRLSDYFGEFKGRVTRLIITPERLIIFVVDRRLSGTLYESEHRFSLEGLPSDTSTQKQLTEMRDHLQTMCSNANI